MCCEAEMPKYKCHKTVWALKIKEIEIKADGSAVITPADKGFGVFAVNASYVTKHNPKACGYYVRYGGGYESYSPADAFESGYSRV